MPVVDSQYLFCSLQRSEVYRFDGTSENGTPQEIECSHLHPRETRFGGVCVDGRSLYLCPCAFPPVKWIARESLTMASPLSDGALESDAPGPVTVLRPQRGWQMINFVELWHFRDLLYFLAWRDVLVRYKQ